MPYIYIYTGCTKIKNTHDKKYTRSLYISYYPGPQCHRTPRTGMRTTPTRTPRTEYAKPLPGHLVPMASTCCSKATASYLGTSYPWPAP